MECSSSTKIKHLHEQAHLKESMSVTFQNRLQNHAKNGSPIALEEDAPVRCSDSTVTSRLSDLGTFLPQHVNFAN